MSAFLITRNKSPLNPSLVTSYPNSRLGYLSSKLFTLTALWEVNKGSDVKYNSTPLALMSNNKLAATQSSSLVESSTLIPLEAEQVEILEQLTHEEQRDRYRLELGVEQAFIQAGKALAQLRSRRLYRSTHMTFEAYCQDRFGFTRRHSDYLIAGAAVVENLQETRTSRSQNDLNENLRTIHSQILPTKLEQIKPLANLKPDDQRQVWDKAVETAGGKVPSGRIVRGLVEQLKEKPLVLNKDYCQVGDVFTLVRLEGKEKKYNGCWAITKELRDFTVVVDVHDTTLTVKPNNLDKIGSPDVKRQLPQILQRIRRLRQLPGFGDRVAYTVLEHLGRQIYLTPLEDKVVRLMEQEYGVENVE